MCCTICPLKDKATRMNNMSKGVPINRSGRHLVAFYMGELTIFPPARWVWDSDGDGGQFTIKQNHFPAVGPAHLEFFSLPDPYDLDNLIPPYKQSEYAKTKERMDNKEKDT